MKLGQDSRPMVHDSKKFSSLHVTHQFFMSPTVCWTLQTFDFTDLLPEFREAMDRTARRID
jgi:hypothetical protein